MDLVTHALTGASTGAVFGRPILGAVLGVLPDLVLPLRRLPAPPLRYAFTHSLLFLLIATAIGVYFELGLLVFFALGSHLVLDVPTHGPTWAPRLLFPTPHRFSGGEEWEFFNDAWHRGFALTLIWISVCAFLLLFVTGSRS